MYWCTFFTSIEDNSSSVYHWSVLRRVDQWILNLFVEGVQPESIKRMSYPELRYWSEKAEQIQKAKKNAAKKK